MLDLTSAFSELYQVKLFDGTVLSLKRPTQKLQRKIVDLQKLGDNIEDSEAIMRATMDIFAQVLNRNDKGLMFTAEDIEEEYDFSVALIVISDYLKFYNQEVAKKVNFRTTQ